MNDITLEEKLRQRLLNTTKLNDLGHHEALFGMLIDQLELYKLAKETLVAEGFTTKSDGRHGIIKKKNPAIAMMSEAMAEFRSLLREFGLSPAQQKEFVQETFEQQSKSAFDAVRPPG